jgi:hypothetical protein
LLKTNLAIWRECTLADFASLTRLHTAVVSGAHDTDLRQAVVGKLCGISIVLIYTN